MFFKAVLTCIILMVLSVVSGLALYLFYDAGIAAVMASEFAALVFGGIGAVLMAVDMLWSRW